MTDGAWISDRLRTIFLDECSPVRRLRRWIYWRSMGLLHGLVGTGLYERKWAERRNIPDSIFSDSMHPHRRWLLDRFASIGPFASVLEIGCGPGVNLQLLCERFQLGSVCGIDINAPAIEEAAARMSRMGFKNTTFHIGKADDLSSFANKSIDVVFSDATLLYIGPDKIGRALAEMKRVARKRLLLLELHQPNTSGPGVHTPDGWLRDYRMALINYFDESSISIAKVPTEAWPAGRWPIYGHLIVADIS